MLYSAVKSFEVTLEILKSSIFTIPGNTAEIIGWLIESHYRLAGLISVCIGYPVPF